MEGSTIDNNYEEVDFEKKKKSSMLKMFTTVTKWKNETYLLANNTVGTNDRSQDRNRSRGKKCAQHVATLTNDQDSECNSQLRMNMCSFHIYVARHCNTPNLNY